MQDLVSLAFLLASLLASAVAVGTAGLALLGFLCWLERRVAAPVERVTDQAPRNPRQRQSRARGRPRPPRRVAA
jgi:uncharacterized iron-regulated membrane protein